MMNEEMELVREYAARQSEPAFEMLVTRYINLVSSGAAGNANRRHTCKYY
jgi:hypothetical protein